MKKDKQIRNDIFTRRSLLIGGAKTGIVSLLLARMYYLQIIEGQHYNLLAEDNRINLELIVPERGEIFDRHGFLLAQNLPNYQILLHYQKRKEIPEHIQKIKPFLTEQTINPYILDIDLKDPKMTNPLLIAEYLTWEDISKIEVHMPQLPGFQIRKGTKRFYPHREKFGHITGYVSKPAEDEVKEPITRRPEFRIGKNGLEKTYDLFMRGEAGRREIEVNAYGHTVRELSFHEGQKGQNLQTSISIELQEEIIKIAGEKTVSCVVMDVETGEVLALVSTPAYDPNDFVGRLSPEKWKELSQDIKSPLKNKALNGLYPPGSTFKMAVALAGLRHGISPKAKVRCPGYHYVGNRRFHCWKRRGHGWVDMRRGIIQSCDVYFYDLALKLGIDKIAEVCNEFGLGVPVDIDLANESRGVIPTKKWLRKRYDRKWMRGDTASAAIGQGYVLATPLQMATMTARFANGLYKVQPRLQRVTAGEDLNFKPLDFDPKHIELIQKAMSDVVNRGGTAGRSRTGISDYKMAGKTGTAQVRVITKKERKKGVIKNRDLPWHLRDHSWFVGYAPDDKPKYCVAVIDEHGGGGSTSAAPIARDALLAVRRILL